MTTTTTAKTITTTTTTTTSTTTSKEVVRLSRKANRLREILVRTAANIETGRTTNEAGLRTVRAWLRAQRRAEIAIAAYEAATGTWIFSPFVEGLANVRFEHVHYGWPGNPPTLEEGYLLSAMSEVRRRQFDAAN